MIILGIDPGTATTGYALIECIDNHHTKLICADAILTPTGQKLEHRLEEIYNSITTLIKNYKPDALAIEALFFARNVKTAISVSHARGVMILAGAVNQVPVFEYTPLQIKQAVTGYGKADKKQVIQMLKYFIKNQELTTQDDTCDAIACALTHAQTINIK
ncbi:MAG: crossover junction endodeoxyribonuclease RuvC [Patescibacteria group bacterium]|jgi:crossover junction endodeoxyribonuclease RuvC